MEPFIKLQFEYLTRYVWPTTGVMVDGQTTLNNDWWLKYGISTTARFCLDVYSFLRMFRSNPGDNNPFGAVIRFENIIYHAGAWHINNMKIMLTNINKNVFSIMKEDHAHMDMEDKFMCCNVNLDTFSKTVLEGKKPPVKKNVMDVVIYEFNAESKDQLSLKFGDIITITDGPNGGWCEGYKVNMISDNEPNPTREKGKFPSYCLLSNTGKSYAWKYCYSINKTKYMCKKINEKINQYSKPLCDGSAAFNDIIMLPRKDDKLRLLYTQRYKISIFKQTCGLLTIDYCFGINLTSSKIGYFPIGQKSKSKKINFIDNIDSCDTNPLYSDDSNSPSPTTSSSRRSSSISARNETSKVTGKKKKSQRRKKKPPSVTGKPKNHKRKKKRQSIIH